MYTCGLRYQREAEFSLPLQKIKVHINNWCTEAGILDQGSQIVVIREDLAKEASVQINTEQTLRMKGANSSTLCTLGCAEDLNMRICDMSFTIHAHVVHTAPFRLLLGCPFHHLLLCRLENHPDRVDIFIHDLANPARSFSVPSQAHKGAQVGFVLTLACQIQSELPHMESFDHHINLSSSQSLINLLLAEHNTDSTATVLAYKKVAKRVHLIAASLPEDFQII